MAQIARTSLCRVGQKLLRDQSLACTSVAPTALATKRWFRSGTPWSTDGVFKELTSQRVRGVPWITALRRRQAEENSSFEPVAKSELTKDRDLTPKRMNDSYHSVVLPLAQDPWLLDTYANSSGHIRLGTLFMDLDALSGVIA